MFSGYALGYVVAGVRMGSTSGIIESEAFVELKGGTVAPPRESLRLWYGCWVAETVGAMPPTDKLWPVPTTPAQSHSAVGPPLLLEELLLEELLLEELLLDEPALLLLDAPALLLLDAPALLLDGAGAAAGRSGAATARSAGAAAARRAGAAGAACLGAGAASARACRSGEQAEDQ